MKEKKYAILIPENLYRIFEQIGKECEQKPLELIREAFRLYLASHEVQRRGGGVFLKEENEWEQGIQVKLGGIADLEDIAEDF